MSLFQRKQYSAGVSGQRQVLENTVKSARNNLLLILVFTLINIYLLVTSRNTYFLFSAYVPYILVDYMMFFGGLYPEEYYGEYINSIELWDKRALVLVAALAAVSVLLYVLCWFFSKKNPKGWLMFAMVLFAVDTVLMVWIAGISAPLIMDYVFHAWVMISLLTGLSAVKKLKELPEEEPVCLDIEPEELPVED